MQLKNKILLILPSIFLSFVILAGIIWMVIPKGSKIKLDPNGGIITKFEINNVADLEEPAKREGYVFAGWYQNGAKVDQNTKLSGNVTLIAKWNKLVNVKLNPDGGVLQSNIETNLQLEKSKPFGLLAAPLKENFAFLGWFDGDNLVTENTIVAKDEYVLTARFGVEVFFDSNGGQAFSAQAINLGQKALNPGSPSKPSDKKYNYFFQYWALNGNRFDFDSPVNTNTTLTAVYEKVRVRYTITLENETVSKFYNDPVGDLPVLTKENLEFVGWFNGDRKVESTHLVTKNLVLVPKFKATISFENADLNPTKVFLDSYFNQPSAPLKDNFVFSHWSIDNVPVTNWPIHVQKNLSLKANFDEVSTIALNLNGGSLALYAPLTYNVARNKRINVLPTPTFGKFSFGGWYDDDQQITNASIATKSHYVLTARYNARVVLDLNGGKLSLAQSQVFDNLEYNATFSNIPTPTKQNLSFKGWYDGENLITTSTVVKKQTYNLRAVYQAHVTIDTDSPQSKYAPRDVIENGTISLDNPYKHNSEFDRWYDTTKKQIIYKFPYTISQNTKIVALWSNLITVVFNLNGASMPTNQSDIVRVPFNNSLGNNYFEPILGSASFIGWFEGEDKITADTILDKSIYSLVAKWQGTSAITYDLNGGRISGSALGTLNYGTIGAQFYLLPTASLSNTTFKGWYIDDEKVTAQTVIENSSYIFKARWNGSVNITLDRNNGYSSTSIRLPYGRIDGEFNKLHVSNRPSLANATFSYWTNNSSPVTSATVLSAPNYTFKANWNESATIYLNPQNDSSPSSFTVPYGSANLYNLIYNKPTPSKLNVVGFNSWVDNNGNDTLERGNITINFANRYYYAKYNVKLTFDLDGVSEFVRSYFPTDSYKKFGAIKNNFKPTQNNATFRYWIDKATMNTLNDNTPIDTNKTLLARWEFRVRYYDYKTHVHESATRYVWRKINVEQAKSLLVGGSKDISGTIRIMFNGIPGDIEDYNSNSEDIVYTASPNASSYYDLASPSGIYEFMGWYLRNSNTPYTFGQKLRSHLDLVPKFAKTIRYRVNGDYKGGVTLGTVWDTFNGDNAYVPSFVNGDKFVRDLSPQFASHDEPYKQAARTRFMIYDNLFLPQFLYRIGERAFFQNRIQKLWLTPLIERIEAKAFELNRIDRIYYHKYVHIRFFDHNTEIFYGDQSFGGNNLVVGRVYVRNFNNQGSYIFSGINSLDRIRYPRLAVRESTDRFFRKTPFNNEYYTNRYYFDRDRYYRDGETYMYDTINN